MKRKLQMSDIQDENFIKWLKVEAVEHVLSPYVKLGMNSIKYITACRETFKGLPIGNRVGKPRLVYRVYYRGDITHIYVEIYKRKYGRFYTLCVDSVTSEQYKLARLKIKQEQEGVKNVKRRKRKKRKQIRLSEWDGIYPTKRGRRKGKKEKQGTRNKSLRKV